MGAYSSRRLGLETMGVFLSKKIIPGMGMLRSESKKKTQNLHYTRNGNVETKYHVLFLCLLRSSVLSR
uniref:Uncharacterized protein n=1 Tax=Nelumbo nucifera TaxID=4432 RepID=A0A822ZTP6_NELNU|nr:TPA_asm: hypothetical protein HUJ06_016616 [Nelumbo nucifera]